jgi:large subunit ribosomal protein L25
MVKDIRIKAERRAERGSGAVRRLRRAGFVPAAINRLGGESVALKLNAHEFENMLRHHAGQQLVVTVECDGQPVPTLLREVQSDVMDGHVIHADFGEIDLRSKLRVAIAVRLTGEPEGVRNEGGILEQTLRQIEVECLPTDIVPSFTVDVTALKLGQSLAVRDVKIDSRYTVLSSADLAVATIVAMAAEEVVEEAAPAEVVPGGEPEVITKGKKEEDGEGEAAAPGEKKEPAKGEKKEAPKGEKGGAEKKEGKK